MGKRYHRTCLRSPAGGQGAPLRYHGAMNCLAFIGPIGGPEMIVILVVGLLIFGNRLPEVGRSLGRGLMEF
ncbi:MAG TPA: twin-arginine translocase TatA/TatE family subunit, partial [Planctomycetota bacterium]|nr:twin-arginine translocase TatA/TatE family subunit [Planctomycetota bacterium]